MNIATLIRPEGSPLLECVSVSGFKIFMHHRESDGFADDRAAIAQVFFGGQYKSLLGALSRGDRVLDAGANIGCFTLAAARRIGEEGHVVAVEPHPQNLEVLRKNICANSAGNVTIVDKAIYDGTRSSVRFTGGGVMGHVDPHGTRNVGCTDLPSLVADVHGCAFDAIKMDIEGSEVVVFGSKEAQGVIEGARTLAVEAHSDESRRLVTDTMHRLGFSVGPPQTERQLLARALTTAVAHSPQIFHLYGPDLVGVMRRLVKPTIPRIGQRFATNSSCILNANRSSCSGSPF